MTVVIPHYGSARLVWRTVAGIWRTTRSDRVSVVVADDASPRLQRFALRLIPFVKVVYGERNAGFAANANRGIAAAGDTDVVLLNNDVVADQGWLEALQCEAYRDDDIGIAGPRLLYPDGRIQSAGSHRNLGAPEWFDHRYRFKKGGHPPALVEGDVIGVTGACMYLKRSTLDAIGTFDEGYPMAFEDADLCMRAWDAGLRVVYAPASVLVHLESVTRGMTQGDRETVSKQRFWDRWGSSFDDRDVRTADGMLKIAYVTEGTGVGGGHRVVFEHLNRLAARGHQVELYSLEGEPDWFDLNVPVHTFDDYDSLARALAPVHAMKVATWWRTAAPVWRASVLNGIPVYFVQDIESSYYNDNDPLFQHALASYRHEFRYLTTSNWVASELRALGMSPTPVAPGLALETYHETGAERRDDVLLSLGRAHPLKNLPLTLDGWRGMDEPRPELWLFGVEPEVAPAEGARYFQRPSDDEVNDLLNTATVLAQTSRHEGFCLPLLEAMAAGTPVVCTDAHGNRDFCSHGVNCLMVDARPEALTEALERLFGDAELRERLRANGRRTAERYAWELKIDELEAFFVNLADEAARTARPAIEAPAGS